MTVVGGRRERYAEVQGSVRAMQRALLPDVVPVLPDAEIAARYLLSSDEAAAGGDWFDAVPAPDGSTILVVGDVVGHGQQAAVAMGQLRSVLLSQLRAGTGLAAALEFLDTFAASVPAARRATVCLVRVAPDGAVEYCTAGHTPPLIVDARPDHGSAGDRYLPPSGAGPLVTGTSFHTLDAHLQVGEAVILYTDGILERPGTTTAAAAVELLTTAGSAARNRIMPAGAPHSAAERICTLSLELLTRQHGYVDDITILAFQRRPPVPDLRVDLDAGPTAVSDARRALSVWLDECGAQDKDHRILMSVVTELVANVLDHAHLGGQPAPFTLRAELRPDGELELEVADRGTWKLPIVTGERGRGLAIVRALVGYLDLDQSTRGTTARVRHPLHRAAGLHSPQPTPPAAINPTSSELFDVWSRGADEPVITVVGPLDAQNIHEVEPFLGLALTAAADTVTVDLSAVTLLASAGVDLLFTTAGQARTAGLDLRLLAPNGSPAQQILDLVNLPHQHRPSPTP